MTIELSIILLSELLHFSERSSRMYEATDGSDNVSTIVVVASSINIAPHLLLIALAL